MGYQLKKVGKCNPIERVWSVLENYWRGEILDSIEKVLGLSRTMKWNGKNPTVEFVKEVYAKGVKLTKKAMEQLEKGFRITFISFFACLTISSLACYFYLFQYDKYPLQ